MHLGRKTLSYLYSNLTWVSIVGFAALYLFFIPNTFHRIGSFCLRKAGCFLWIMLRWNHSYILLLFIQYLSRGIQVHLPGWLNKEEITIFSESYWIDRIILYWFHDSWSKSYHHRKGQRGNTRTFHTSILLTTCQESKPKGKGIVEFSTVIKELKHSKMIFPAIQFWQGPKARCVLENDWELLQKLSGHKANSTFSTGCDIFIETDQHRYFQIILGHSMANPFLIHFC